MVKWINTKQTTIMDGKECVVFCNEKDPNDKRVRKFKIVDGKRKATYKKIDKSNKRGGSLIAVAAIYPVMAIIVFILVLIICKVADGDNCGSEAFKYGLLWPFALIMILIDAGNRGGGSINKQFGGTENPLLPSETDIKELSKFATQLYTCSTNYILNASSQDVLIERLALLHAIFTCAKLGRNAKAIRLSIKINLSDLRLQGKKTTYIALPIQRDDYAYYFNMWQKYLGIKETDGQNHNDIRTDLIPEVYGKKSYLKNTPGSLANFKKEITKFYTEIQYFISKLESLKSVDEIREAFSKGPAIDMNKVKESVTMVENAWDEVLPK